MGTQLLSVLPRVGTAVDAFFSATPDEIPDELREIEGLSITTLDLGWRAGRWYSSEPLTQFAGGQLIRALAQNRLVRQIAERHARSPYDALYQFSQLELFAVRRLRHALPPIVVHPEVHAAGELHWHRKERRLARDGESLARYTAVHAMLQARTLTQRRDLRYVKRVIAPSRMFAHLLAEDYGLSERELRVVPNPVDLERFHPDTGRPLTSGAITLLYVSRIAVRKGVELIVDLSNRLADLEGRVRLLVVGGHTLWSDYRRLLTRLNPSVAEYCGEVQPGALPALYRDAAALLQPSHYEPFALTVAEALASGVPVVVSDAVGAAEDVDGSCCRVFATGDPDAFEDAVRRLVRDLSNGNGVWLSQRARDEATRRFSPTDVARSVVKVLEDARP
jgi:glycosyltransferase involved in cell wall biosynthesis